MANVQREFVEFIKKIKLINEEETLREKREAVLEALKKGLKHDFEAKGEPVPQFAHFSQGSYSLKTGIKPEGDKNDYDIDVGIVYKVDPSDYDDDPVELKRWTRDALEDHTNDVRIKTPCVTVSYAAGYHVDLAIYANPEGRTKDELPLAWGKNQSSKQEWQTNHPSRLRELIKETFDDKADREQFRRCIRALKRWRDRKYKSATSHAAPVGVGLTVAGLVGDTQFQPNVDLYNNRNDRTALEQFVQALLNNFQDSRWSEKDAAYGRRLVVELPFAPYNDVFARITNKNMELLENRLKDLLEDLIEAGSTSSRKEACDAMRLSFGEDFPEGEDDDTTKGSKPSARVVVPPHTSGSE